MSGSHVPGSQVPRSMFPSLRVTGFQVSESRVSGSRVSGSQGLGLQGFQALDLNSQGPESLVSDPDFRLCHHPSLDKKNRHEKKNYRPVSIISVISKILAKRCLYDQIYKSIDNNLSDIRWATERYIALNIH